jgi:hypothetical protein
MWYYCVVYCLVSNLCLLVLINLSSAKISHTQWISHVRTLTTRRSTPPRRPECEDHVLLWIPITALQRHNGRSWDLPAVILYRKAPQGPDTEPPTLGILSWYMHRIMFVHTEHMQDSLTTIMRAGTLFLLTPAVLSLLVTMPVHTPSFRCVISMLTSI